MFTKHLIFLKSIIPSGFQDNEERWKHLEKYVPKTCNGQDFLNHGDFVTEFPLKKNKKRREAILTTDGQYDVLATIFIFLGKGKICFYWKKDEICLPFNYGDIAIFTNDVSYQLTSVVLKVPLFYTSNFIPFKFYPLKEREPVRFDESKNLIHKVKKIKQK